MDPYRNVGMAISAMFLLLLMPIFISSMFTKKGGLKRS